MDEKVDKKKKEKDIFLRVHVTAMHNICKRENKKEV